MRTIRGGSYVRRSIEAVLRNFGQEPVIFCRRSIRLVLDDGR